MIGRSRLLSPKPLLSERFSRFAAPRNRARRAFIPAKSGCGQKSPVSQGYSGLQAMRLKLECETWAKATSKRAAVSMPRRSD
jgi:hypothetical protein